ncbi:MAG TPA: SNF2-related protein, partial [Desulfopila sp.]|nr:SNF2-related protein [Desulfopila sp.]
MYNFDIKTLPAVLPVLEMVQFKPWFSEPTLNQGLDLLRRGSVDGFDYLRNAVGAVIDNKALVTMQFEASKRLHQGFVIRSGYCGLCRGKSERDGCEHLAALAILSIDSSKSKEKAQPLPLAFAGGSWEKIGLFFYEWLGQSGYAATWNITDGAVFWEAVTQGGSLGVAIPGAWRRQAETILTGECPQSGGPQEQRIFKLLRDQLKVLTMTPAERDLEEAGSSTIGWRRDTSCWIWLAKMLYCLHGETLPRFHQLPGTFQFSLILESEDGERELKSILPGARAWSLVRQLDFTEKEATILAKARECFRVGMTTGAEIEVIPCLQLEDGRVLTRRELAKTRFTGGYYLPGEGFLPVQRIAREGILSRTPLQSSMPLLGFLQDEAQRDVQFTIPFDEIPAFLEASQAALHHPDNIVAAEVLNTVIHPLPDRLIIDDFEEHEGWCYLSCRYGLGNTSISLEDILAARKKGMSSLPGEGWLQIEGTPLTWLYDLAEDQLTADGSDRIRIGFQEMLALSAVIGEVEVAQKQQVRKRLANLLDEGRWTETATLSESPEHLRDYQRNGLAWLLRLYSLGIGGLLADDMGLGKTHQALALLQSTRGSEREKVHMVVCPASVVLNWADKIDRFYPDLNYAVHYGNQRDLEEARKSGLILTTYGIVRHDLALLQEYAFDVIILDEIQNVKNRSTATHQAIAALNGRITVGLTGTPIENSLADLHALFDICLPGLLGSERQF